MPQSLARVVLHVVFSTKNRVPFFKDQELRAELHAYMAGVLQRIGCEPILINGVEDHVHILCNLSRTITIAGLVEEAKKSPSKWVKDKGPGYSDFFWQVDMARSPSANRTSSRCVPTSPSRMSIIASFRSRTNSARCVASTAWSSMNVTFGTDPRSSEPAFVSPRWGSDLS